MPFATTGGSLVTGSNIVDQSIGIDDLSDTLIEEIEPTLTTEIPTPVCLHEVVGDNTLVVSSNTTAALGKVLFKRGITATKLTFSTGNTVTTPGTVKIALFSEDGQTKIFEKTTQSLSATDTKYTEDLDNIVIPAGEYWLMVLPVSTTNLRLTAFSTGSDGSFTSNLLGLHTVTGEHTLVGRYTVTASTIPSTLTLSSITAETTTNSILVTRFDA